MLFRQDLRNKLPALCGAVRIDHTAILAPAPAKPDELDDAIVGVAVLVLGSAQYAAFVLRYFGNEDDRADRERIVVAYQILRNRGDDGGNGVSFEAIVRNSNRAVERLGDVLRHQATGAGHRQTILEGWQNAQKNSQ